MTKTRLEAFSDAVIAIIITIMVLELRAPHGSGWSDLSHNWEFFVSYAISFINLAIYWGNHHHLIHTIREVRGGILWANIHLLFWLSLIPFGTAWMGETHFATNPVILYAVIANFCGIAYYILLIVIKKCNPGNHALQKVLHKQSRKGMISCIIYTLAIPLAFVNAWASGALNILVAVMWLMPDRNIERALTDHEH